MLVLSRKKNESIMIGDIQVRIVNIRGSAVVIGIEAPKNVPVHRREIYNKIDAQNKLASGNPFE